VLAGGTAGALAVLVLLAAGPAAKAEVPQAAAEQPAAALGTLSVSRNADGTWTYQVSNGPAEGSTTSLPFPLAYLQIHVADTVTWTNQDPARAYTVTFPDASGAYPDPGSPDALAPMGGPSYDGSAITSSGVLAPAGQPGNHSYSLAFTTQAVFQYRNLLDTSRNDVGVISVMAMFWARLPGVATRV
jgi:VCBS repeat-containing protein